MAQEHLLGAHMSISGGIDLAIDRGEQVGCHVMQVFTKNSNQWQGKALEESVIESYKSKLEKSPVSEVIAHDSYLINLASPEKEMRQRSFDAFLDEMERCRKLGISSLVMHPGSHKGAGEEGGLKIITEEFNELLAMTDGWGVHIVVETTAGQGTNLGYRFEHIASIIDGVKEKDRIKVCFDTCHVFAAGYDLSTEEGYYETMERFESLIGLDRLAAFHINDSKKALGSRVDRHEHLGKGELGETPFRLIMNDPRFAGIPKILETPKGKEMEEDKVNLAYLRNLVR
ncbi:MAG: deoxyribonuclease IV [Deltaproteobacteria bacterium]|nr:deoxyribonuclease IV [Deltaproteobacteria bacterium]